MAVHVVPDKCAPIGQSRYGRMRAGKLRAAEQCDQRPGVHRTVRADAAIVQGPGLRYVIAIYARQVEDTRWSVDNDALVTGGDIARMVHDHFLQ